MERGLDFKKSNVQELTLPELTSTIHENYSNGLPCGGIYQLGSPIVEEASIALPGDKTFTIRTHGGSAKAIYVKKYVLNGKQLKEPHITHKQIMEGGTLDVYMTEK